ncbi:hypothetical protein M422DRAFT_261212 [Sphaerobolus stellatus SS14]|uniref:Uncharacterized protein n=1 Tax=Sphaerobolus stellatus (strain SS14) TaxID=990650 RepID=A0A0C9V408_SPHS4|nr:hypothetical protein M422DRAFT_261212 [Sphaerobolus stellatus SS14]
MTDAPFPAHMLAWKASSDIIHMEEIPVSDPTRTVQGFAPDKKFNVPAPKLTFDNPYEDDEDRLNKVNKYWKARNKERLQRETHYKELLDAEVTAAERRKAEEAMQAQSKAREDEAREKEKEKELEKEKEAGLSGNAKGKARELPKTPKKATPKKSQHEVRSESEEDEDEDKPQSCIYCVKKKIQRQEAGRLEGVWYDLQRFMMEVEQWVAVDSAAANAKLLQLLELKSKGVEIPADLEKRIHMERGLVQDTLKEHTDDLTEQMDAIQKRTA